MCFHDSITKVATLNYSFAYQLTEVYPYPGGGTRTDDFTSSISFTMTRVTLASKGLVSPLQSISGIDSFLNPGEFFLLSSCCCPCNWTFVPKFVTPLSAVASQTRNVVFATHPPPNLSGTVTFGADINFGLIPNIAQYPTLCGDNVTYTAQSMYWPTFDGVTPNDPVDFDIDGNDVDWPITGYTGSPALDPGSGAFDGGSIVSPFFPAPIGYFQWYNPASGPPPTPITGVTGSGNGFRDPCSTSMNFNQTVSWTMSAVNGAGDTVNGTGTGSIAIAFSP